MEKPSFDPGLTNQFSAPLSRMINRNGTFNVRRRGDTWRDFHPYLHLINMGWTPFLAVLFAGFVVLNTVFAAAYWAIGLEQLQGIDTRNPAARFLDAFFFSAHTLTTVGYGNIAPHGMG